jgi:predicted MPP superfamily phosphohydrolase
LEWIAPIFSRMTGRLGQFAILGNHDYRHDGPGILRELGRGGFEGVDGRWVRLECGGTALAIGGTSYPWGSLPDPSTIPSADYRILLSHSPDMLYRASSWGVDLMLSGHNHGGQIRLPVLGPILMPSRYSRRFDRGFFRHDRTLLYVSRGVGGKDPIRYGAPPEIARFVLQPAPRTGTHRSPTSRASLSPLDSGGVR